MRHGQRCSAVALAVALVATACGGGDPVADDGVDAVVGDVADDQDDGSATAELGILAAGVDVADEPDDPAAAAFRTGEDGEGLAVRDLVRTDTSGFAEVRWFDGALARVDADTTYALVELDTTPGAATVVTDLDVGRIWNRLRADEVDAYEVTTDVGTAAVRGTAFWVQCLTAGCTFAVLEGTVLVVAGDGAEVELTAGQQVTVDADGVPGDVEATDVEDPWVVRNDELDQGVGFEPLPQPDAPALAGGCPFDGPPDGWVEEPATEGQAADFCRYVRPDAGANEFALVEWFAEDGPAVRDNTNQNRPFYEDARDTIAGGTCSDGMRDEFIEYDGEQLGRGELFGFAWLAARGPLTPQLDDCINDTGSSFNAVIVDGQVFVLRLAEVPDASCQPPEPNGETAEQWDAYLDCIFTRFTTRQDRYRALAQQLLGT